MNLFPAGEPLTPQAEDATLAPEYRPPCEFFIVAIGASAGGLEALEDLFQRMPLDTGMAFVVLQHLSPDYESHMDSLLRRQTKIPIQVATDGVLVEPNHIYLNPPKKDMIIAGRQLLLTDKDPERGLSLPIDHFFRSLAQDVGRCAIGVVLSGTGSDGSRGVRAIHEIGGLVISQTEETAKFDGMPRNAEQTGCVDLILPPEAIPDALLKYARKNQPGQNEHRENEASPARDMERVFKLLRSEYGIDFSLYKPSTVMRRIDRRMSMYDGCELKAYIGALEQDRNELNSLYKDLLIGVTRFFRDQEAFDRLATDVIPGILSRASATDEIRIWVPGCATGEEAYSIAMLLLEQKDILQRPHHIRIFATDVHRTSLETASAGLYSEEALAEVSRTRRQRFFRRVREKYQVVQELRQMVVFAPHNVVADAPFTRLDLIVCRNLLIYFQPIAQKKVLSLFHFGLKTGGVLFLGPSETPGDLQDEFDPIDKHWRIYRKRRDVRLTPDIRLPTGAHAMSAWSPSRASANGRSLNETQIVGLYDRLVGRHLPPSILTDDRGELLHVFGGAESFLRVRGGRPSSNVLELIADEIRTALSGAIQHAVKENKLVSYTGVHVPGGESSRQLRLTVDPIQDPATRGTYLLITFERLSDVAAPLEPATDIDYTQVPRDHVQNLESELRHTRENLQATIEELETSNEELQAANEELVASNEELQSTNEELHSVNEELYTVNAEYQRKITELTELTDDMNNLLYSTDVGVIFLDTELCIRKFTPRIGQAFHLLPQDVGRPLHSFANNLEHTALLDDLQQVLTTGGVVERTTRDAKGNHHLLRVLPYKSRGNVEGVVVTLIDIERLKQQEATLRRLSDIVESSEAPIVGTDLGGTIMHWNGGAAALFNCPPREAVGLNLATFFPPEKSGEIYQLLDDVRSGRSMRPLEFVAERRGDQTQLLIRWTVSAVRGTQGELIGVSLVGTDNTDRKVAEDRLLESEHRMRQIVESAMDAIIGMDERGLVTGWNPKAEKVFRYTAAEAIGRPLADLIIPPETRAAHWEGLRQFLETGRAKILNKRLELIAARRGGQTFPIELTVAANKVGPRYEFSAFIRDITQRRNAERRLATEHAISQILINAADLPTATPRILMSFCRTLEVDAAMMWLPDALGQQLWCSGAYCKLSGDAAEAFQRASQEETVAPGVGLVGNVWRRREPMWNTDLATSPENERVRLAVEAGLTTSFAFPLMLNQEVMGVIEFYAREELTPNVALLEMMMAVGHDVGQMIRRTRFERELADARRAAEAANDAKSAFLANMSHEIRTPMTSVVGLTELLLTSETDSQRIEMLKMIQRSSHHLVELINDILDLSKIESGKLSVERVHCSPVELVQDLASVMAIRAKDRGLAFEVAYGGRIPETIYTDPMRLRQILINLVGNAIKFTNEGSVCITLRYHSEGPRPQIEFEVRDTGIGMSAEHLEQLFVPFSQADHSVTRRFGGTGLGLCISQRLANALNGEIRVESQLGVGSSFRLLVAADDTAELIDPATQWTSVVTEPTPPEEIKLNCRALVAEDTRGIQYLIKRFLEAAGAEVLLAQNGQEAIDQVLENRDRGSPIDVVLMDMHMPVLSGYDAVRLLRQQKFDLPIVALTARAMQGDREKCLDAGCNDYLPKPVDRRQLLEAVARQLHASS